MAERQSVLDQILLYKTADTRVKVYAQSTTNGSLASVVLEMSAEELPLFFNNRFSENLVGTFVDGGDTYRINWWEFVYANTGEPIDYPTDEEEEE